MVLSLPSLPRAPIALLLLGCGSTEADLPGEDEPFDPVIAFEQAARLEVQWCEQLQIAGANLAETALADAVELHMVESKAALTGSHTKIVPGDDPSIVIYGYGERADLGGTEPRTNHRLQDQV